ncbi:MAG TPA: hypothetical protein VGQ47_01615 [Candidatus Limnocylindrales bacterium]|nr:hypothetical protein [Candidatus Limnocylindrales bacterium]
MFALRQSAAERPNTALAELEPKRAETNRAWLDRAGADEGVLLLGGASLVDFRVRVAQSLVRHDLTPSHWSMAGILVGGGRFLSVPLDLGADISAVPATNGARECSLADYDDPALYPNIAVLRFVAGTEPIRAAADQVSRQRSVLDLPALVLAWLAYAWGVDDRAPLLDGKGLPSAAFVESAYAIANVELTPGLASTSSCPEAIWQAAKWWGDYYREAASLAIAGVAPSPGHAIAQVPSGTYALRQRVAAIAERQAGRAARRTRRAPRRR